MPAAETDVPAPGSLQISPHQTPSPRTNHRMQQNITHDSHKVNTPEFPVKAQLPKVNFPRTDEDETMGVRG
jgi:hypothetical protein